MATASAKRSPGDKLGNWILDELIGGGGNGFVWRVKPRSGGGAPMALKVLKRTSDTIFSRFMAEIAALKMAKGIDGVIPLIDDDLPHSPTSKPRWYVMPIAGKFDDFLAAKDATDIVDAFVPLARTLAELHDLEIHHRDIKPANILSLKGRLCFSDFGLVRYPGKEHVTQPKKELGPKFLMAPEMRRDADSADGAPADTFSFAKSLWIGLTGRHAGFDGQYSAGGDLDIRRSHPDMLSAPLDELLTECTDNDPKRRPTMMQVATRLAEWVDTMRDFGKRNLTEWVTIQNRIFPFGAPRQCRWTGPEEICAVLRLAADTGGLNHMMLPGKGGATLDGARLAKTPGHIVLDIGWRVELKPASLSFESFGPGSIWNYFWLEAEEISPTGRYGAYLSPDGLQEMLCEIEPGRLVAYSAWHNGEHHGEPLPKGARPLERALKGSFLIVATQSYYNLTSATYDARHQKMGEVGFRQYIERQASI